MLQHVLGLLFHPQRQWHSLNNSRDSGDSNRVYYRLFIDHGDYSTAFINGWYFSVWLAKSRWQLDCC